MRRDRSISDRETKMEGPWNRPVNASRAVLCTCWPSDAVQLQPLLDRVVQIEKVVIVPGWFRAISTPSFAGLYAVIHSSSRSMEGFLNILHG